MKELTLFWFRRDLRLDDNAGLYYALKNEKLVQPIFIFDVTILESLKHKEDKRVSFLFSQIKKIKKELVQLGSDLWVFYGTPETIIYDLFLSFPQIKSIYCNHDYEPYARDRDNKIFKLCQTRGIEFKSFKDQVIFERNEIKTDLDKPYTVFTPYKKKWMATLTDSHVKPFKARDFFSSFNRNDSVQDLFELDTIGFCETTTTILDASDWNSKKISDYAKTKDFPFLEKGTSHLGPSLRFGTVSIRSWVKTAKTHSDVWLSELIWREFFMQILWNFPHVVRRSFKPQYEKIKWLNKKSDFDRWSQGQTGFPIVDAGIRELLQTGFMHNRVRMIVASFLTKHLLTHWYLGEQFFADYLLDYDLAANNGNWQWAAGTGCDAAPYFRIFNPKSQTEKFDPDWQYIKKWIPELETSEYPKPMIDHAFARARALEAYKKGLSLTEKNKGESS